MFKYPLTTTLVQFFIGSCISMIFWGTGFVKKPQFKFSFVSVKCANAPPLKDPSPDSCHFVEGSKRLSPGNDTCSGECPNKRQLGARSRVLHSHRESEFVLSLCVSELRRLKGLRACSHVSEALERNLLRTSP